MRTLGVGSWVSDDYTIPNWCWIPSGTLWRRAHGGLVLAAVVR